MNVRLSGIGARRDRARLSARVMKALAWPQTDRALARAAGRFAAAHGLKARTILRAAHLQPLSAEGRLALCAALGIDPVSLPRVKAATMPPRLGPLLPYVLAARLVHFRQQQGLGLRPAGERLGVSYSTVRRAEHGDRISDHALIAICAGLGIHPHVLTGTPEQVAAIGASPMAPGPKTDGMTTSGVGRLPTGSVTRATSTETPAPRGEERGARPGHSLTGARA